MLLALDVGNTNVKLGVVQAGSVRNVVRADTRPEPAPDAAEERFARLARDAGVTLSDVDSIVLASVVPGWSAVVRAVAERWALPLLEAAPSTVPIAIRVDDPDAVGTDRLVNAFAAGRLHGTPAIVVDLGTATTFDAVAADGAYVGGAIAPGLALGLDALARHTSKLPRVDAQPPARAIATNTVDAIRSGAVLGYAGLVRELVGRIRDELAPGGEPVCTVVTGGLSNAPWVRRLADWDAVDPDLTLRGLASLHAELVGAPA